LTEIFTVSSLPVKAFTDKQNFFFTKPIYACLSFETAGVLTVLKGVLWPRKPQSSEATSSFHIEKTYKVCIRLMQFSRKGKGLTRLEWNTTLFRTSY